MEEEEDIYVTYNNKAVGEIHIHFRLTQHQKNAQDFDLEVKENETLALVGPSGSGKSSIAALLTRMYEPDQGQILIGQRRTPLEAIPKYHVRKSISYVTQVSHVCCWGSVDVAALLFECLYLFPKVSVVFLL